jgi:hypothetical protein
MQDDGRYVQLTDTVSGPSMAVVAPKRFTDSLSRFDGGNLQFDVRESAVPTRGPWSAFGEVAIIRNRREAHADLSCFQ